MTMRQRRMQFNRDHIVKTFRVTSDMADFMNRMGTSERATYLTKALHNFLNGGKPTYSRRGNL